MLVRTWNLFHGNADPPGSAAFLEAMVRLATDDRPDVVCLQEVPVWALARLGEWSGMTAIGDVASRPSLGPLPLTAEIGRRLTAPDHGLFRSAFSGQANAVLLAPSLVPLERRRLVLNPAGFRAAQARWQGLDLVLRLTWAKERRVCQAVRIGLPGGGTAFLANLHATSCKDDRLQDAELLRAACFADALARPDEPLVLAGDFNLLPERSRTLSDLAGPEWGFCEPGDGINHVLVRGARHGPSVRWPLERHTVEGCVLSDHAPVERTVELA